MLRELGVSLLMAGLLTALVLAGLGGREGFIPLTSSGIGGSTAVRGLGNGTQVGFFSYDDPVEIPDLEGYSFNLSLRFALHAAVVYYVPKPLNASRPQQPVPRPLGANFTVTGVEAYILSPADAAKVEAAFDAGLTGEALRLAEARAVARIPMREAGGAYVGHAAVGPGSYKVVVFYRYVVSIPGKMRPGKVFAKPMVDASISVTGTVSPTPVQLFRSLDVAGLGAVLLGLDWYLNREEYAGSWPARTLRRASSALGRLRRGRGREPPPGGGLRGSP